MNDNSWLKVNDSCIGCGACVSICPEVFELNENGKSIVKQKETDLDCAKEAKETCPVGAIEIN